VAEITVTPVDPERFHVTVREGGSSSEHDVTLGAADFARLGPDRSSPEALVRACFAFLLEREPKESILSSFDVTVIGRYFPEFEEAIGRY
jgi:hypothetical protein